MTCGRYGQTSTRRSSRLLHRVFAFAMLILASIVVASTAGVHSGDGATASVHDTLMGVASLQPTPRTPAETAPSTARGIHLTVSPTRQATRSPTSSSMTDQGLSVQTQQNTMSASMPGTRRPSYSSSAQPYSTAQQQATQQRVNSVPARGTPPAPYSPPARGYGGSGAYAVHGPVHAPPPPSPQEMQGVPARGTAPTPYNPAQQKQYTTAHYVSANKGGYQGGTSGSNPYSTSAGRQAPTNSYTAPTNGYSGGGNTGYGGGGNTGYGGGNTGYQGKKKTYVYSGQA